MTERRTQPNSMSYTVFPPKNPTPEQVERWRRLAEGMARIVAEHGDPEHSGANDRNQAE